MEKVGNSEIYREIAIGGTLSVKGLSKITPESTRRTK